MCDPASIDLCKTFRILVMKWFHLIFDGICSYIIILQSLSEDVIISSLITPVFCVVHNYVLCYLFRARVGTHLPCSTCSS